MRINDPYISLCLIQSIYYSSIKVGVILPFSKKAEMRNLRITIALMALAISAASRAIKRDTEIGHAVSIVKGIMTSTLP